MLKNKYYNCYYRIIDKAKTRSIPKNIYSERHHIIPKCCGGNNAKENIIRLYPREHFICHLLLPKIYDNEFRFKLISAAWKLACMYQYRNVGEKLNSRTYEQLRNNVSVEMKLYRKLHPLSPPMLGKKHSKESVQKMRENHRGQVAWNRGIKHSEETKEKIRNKLTGNKNCSGRVLSEETKKKISLSEKGKLISKESTEKRLQTLFKNKEVERQNENL